MGFANEEAAKKSVVVSEEAANRNRFLTGKFSDALALKLIVRQVLTGEAKCAVAQTSPPNDLLNANDHHGEDGEVKILLSEDYPIAAQRRHVLVTQAGSA